MRAFTPTAAAPAVAIIAMLALAGCAGDGAATDAVKLPPTGVHADYQLGGAYEPPAGVGIVARDRTAAPAPGAYSICYVNGFQTQPGELDTWPAATLLRDATGAPVFDPDWPDEAILDTSTTAAREQIHARVSAWIRACARDGFDAVEFDNLDSYTRTNGALSFADNLALATALVATAHRAGLAAGQKNAPGDAEELHGRAGFDFAIAEECSVFSECADYTRVYGTAVIDIEYTDALPRPFSEMCSDPEAPASMTLRDKPLHTPGSPGYAFDVCP